MVSSCSELECEFALWDSYVMFRRLILPTGDEKARLWSIGPTLENRIALFDRLP